MECVRRKEREGERERDSWRGREGEIRAGERERDREKGRERESERQ